ncbi:MAG TPA: pyridoxal-dependent decarboxylase [Gemmatimonadaceae bacterium]|nr:pyridoxal-dependent decarboxylase [Gemmatimonadaceae bacterium]
MNPADFRDNARAIVDWVANYRATIADRPVMAQTAPGDIKAQLPVSPPADAEPFADLLRDFDQIIAPGITSWQSPRFFGYFPSAGSLASVLGDYLSSGIGVIGLSWQACPALTELEEVVTDWMRQMVGLSGAWSGVIQDTASASTLVALICARERTTDYSLVRGGLQAEARPLTVYVSAHAHSSVDKAALLAGFGREHVRLVPHDEAYAMRPDALRDLVAADRAAGRVPCAVVATTGTTGTTALDPVRGMAEVARDEGLWLHVDAAMAGSAMIVPALRWMWDGVEGADSVVLNPHKWLGAVFDCSLYYVRDVEHLVRVMSTNPSYLQSAADGRVKNYRDWGIPLGRRFRALKLWFLIREQGVRALQARITRDVENARWLERAVRAAPHWRVLAPVPLQTVCLRHEPPGLDGEALDRHTLRWVDRVNRSGAAYLTPSMLDGRWMARVSIGAEPTEREHVAALWDELRDAAAAELAGGG